MPKVSSHKLTYSVDMVDYIWKRMHTLSHKLLFIGLALFVVTACVTTAIITRRNEGITALALIFTVVPSELFYRWFTKRKSRNKLV